MWETAIKFVLDIETDKFTNDTEDPGGATKFGISKRAFPNEDIEAMTRDRAIELYKTRYWDVCRCDELPGPVAMIVFDMAVNQGTNIAAKILQGSVGVLVDGVIGDHTLAMAKDAPQLHIIHELTARRIFQYGTTYNFVRFGLGWTRRALQALYIASIS